MLVLHLQLTWSFKPVHLGSYWESVPKGLNDHDSHYY